MMMRKLFSLFMVLVLALGLSCSWAEETQDNFLISDWKLFYAYGDTAIAEQTIFIYDNNTFEVMDEDQSKEGTWVFDGETLTLTADDQELPLKWDEEAHQFTGEFNGMTLTMYVPIEPEDETAEAPVAGK
jgi:hypothetical protein